MQTFYGRRGLRLNSLQLFADDFVGVAGFSREGKDKSPPPFYLNGTQNSPGIDDNAILGKEFNKIHTSEGRCVLILLATGKLQIDAFNLVGQVRNVVRSEWKRKRRAKSLN